MKQSRKIRKTFSLSRHSVRRLESIQQERRAASLTEALEVLISEDEQRERMAKIEAECSAYYTSLSDADMQSDAEWGTAGGLSLLEGGE